MRTLRIILLSLIFAVGLGTYAQTEPEAAQPVVTEQNAQLAEKTVDTIVQPVPVVPEPKKKTWRKKLVWASDTLTTSDYMMSIERINDRLNDILDSARLGVEVVTFGRRIDDLTNETERIRLYVSERQTGVHMKNLYLYHNFLSNLYSQNQRTQQNLKNLYNRLYHSKLRLKGAMTDSVFKALCADSSLRWKFNARMDRLQTKWYTNDKQIREKLRTLNALKLNASENSITLSNMLSSLETRMDKASELLWGEEVNYLWKSDKSSDTDSRKTVQFSHKLDREFKAIGYYFSQTLWQRIFILLITLLLFGWLYYSRNLLHECRNNNRKLAFLNLKYLNNKPVSAILVVVLLMMQFFDAYAPVSYLAIDYLLLIIVISVIFKDQWKREVWKEWQAMLIVALIIVITNLFVESTFIQRFWQLMLYGVMIAYVSRFIKKLDKKTLFYNWIRYAALTSIALAFVGIVANLFGRFSLSCLLGISSVFAILQAIALPVMYDTVQEIVFLQIESSRLRKGIDRPFDHHIVIRKLRLPLTFIILILWFILLTSNLNIYPAISSSVDQFFNATRNVGSVSFRLISILLFFAIIWLAHLLQRLISYALGAVGSDLDDITEVTKGQHSRLLMIRLFVLCSGYLLAIAASGLPLDKITIVLGALSVGIGLGLQSIVNNLISGIILIFDGSLQVGDEIEVSGQSGKVKEIGLRASTINTADGAEVIIPNGILTSQNIVNWTYTNDQRRVMIEFSLSGEELDANVINEIINATLVNQPHVIGKKKPVILFTKVTPEACWLKVHFWTTISKREQVKSEALLHLKDGFASKGMMME
ncbi:mechanosensitive ion channel family protein [Parabacteroides sp. FAFU027]|uniref:mechanosensitive ion channel family protein n=1 Tax=Parabacteroides sp. FAFU027 TaxID=2922715 RepID=UPI001FAFC4B1|nr:mechanosensitive ion channel domain-containing protein [Parabacteroides sp. FAFU027]